VSDEIYTVRVVHDIDDVYHEGEYIKVKIENGRVYPWTGGGMEIYPDEFQFKVSDVERILGL
jgi:hypothetical protein